MTIDFRKTSHIVFFAALLPSLSYGAGWLSAQLLPNAPFWVETLSPLAAYALLYSLFDRFAWHWPLFRLLGIVTVPDVRGRWLGQQTSSFKDANDKHRKSRVILEIDQTFSNVKTTTYYQKWHSSQSASCFMPINGEVVLISMFESEPKADYDGEATAHKGVVRLTQVHPGKLVGTYFNAEGRKGELAFTRTRYTLHHTFDSIGGGVKK